MSVQKNHYVLFGIRLEYDIYNELIQELYKKENPEADKLNIEYEAYEKYVSPYTDSAFKGISQTDGITIVYDGMNGEFVWIGQVLQKSKDHGDLDDYHHPAYEGVYTKMPKDTAIKKFFKEQYGMEDPGKMALYVFTLYE